MSWINGIAGFMVGDMVIIKEGCPVRKDGVFRIVGFSSENIAKPWEAVAVLDDGQLLSVLWLTRTPIMGCSYCATRARSLDIAKQCSALLVEIDKLLALIKA